MTRVAPAFFDGLYAKDADPWRFTSSDYERGKYARTLEACGPGPFAAAFEAGCSIGVFTRLLAPRCRRLLAVDCAEAAVRAARERCADQPAVTVERRLLPEELPAGPLDLIVCSEVLYYWDRPLLLGALDVLRRALAPGGALVAVHWTPPTETYPLRGAEVHEILAERLGDLAHARHERHPKYLLDRFEAVA